MSYNMYDTTTQEVDNEIYEYSDGYYDGMSDCFSDEDSDYVFYSHTNIYDQYSNYVNYITECDRYNDLQLEANYDNIYSLIDDIDLYLKNKDLVVKINLFFDNACQECTDYSEIRNSYTENDYSSADQARCLKTHEGHSIIFRFFNILLFFVEGCRKYYLIRQTPIITHEGNTVTFGGKENYIELDENINILTTENAYNFLNNLCIDYDCNCKLIKNAYY